MKRRRRRQLGASTIQRNEAVTFGIMASGVMLGAFAGHRLFNRSGFAASIGALGGFVLGSMAVGWRLSR
jgi:hypothetical protein